ncbi:MAG: cupin domain-containing protein [Phycisphaeraceae bacterium]|nr:cupin domain-containing protein [Phycisphaeraceae bacterium]MCW5753306.1 cupin domain-containing protein [Phycisphaeraceae bacterium]
MLIRNIQDVPLKPVQMEGVRGASMALMIGREHGAPHFSLRHFRVEPGGHTPRHSHDYEHEVFVVAGQGTVLLEGSTHPIKAGDTILVPANEEHQFTSDPDQPDGLRFLCLVPVSRNCGEVTPGS